MMLNYTLYLSYLFEQPPREKMKTLYLKTFLIQCGKDFFEGIPHILISMSSFVLIMDIMCLSQENLAQCGYFEYIYFFKS